MKQLGSYTICKNVDTFKRDYCFRDVNSACVTSDEIFSVCTGPLWPEVFGSVFVHLFEKRSVHL